MIFGRPDQRLSGSHTPYPAPGDSRMGGTPPDSKGGTGPQEPLKGGDAKT
jgi:hypothetical protein